MEEEEEGKEEHPWGIRAERALKRARLGYLDQCD